MKRKDQGSSLRRTLMMFLGLIFIFTLAYMLVFSGGDSGEGISLIAEPTSTIRVGPLVIDAIQRNAKLETITMVIANDTTITREHGILGVCTESINYLAYYNVSAGIDLRQISREHIHVSNDGLPELATVTIDLPAAQIFHSELDTEASRLLSQDTPRWIPGCSHQIADMTLEAQNILRNKAREAAQERGILSLAETHAADELKRLLNEAGYEQVEIRTWGSRMNSGTAVPTVPVAVPTVPVAPVDR